MGPGAAGTRGVARTEPGNSLARASMKSTGSPTQISGAFAVGKQSRFARMTQDPVIRTGAGNTLKLMPAAQDPWDPAQLGRAGSREPSRAKARQRRAGIRHRADINSRQLPLSEPLCLRAQGCLYPTRPMSKAGGADRLPARAGCTFCHEQQKVPKNALHVTFAARTAGGAALSRAAPLPLNQFTAKDLCLGRQSRFARMTQDPVACAGVKQ